MSNVIITKPILNHLENSQHYMSGPLDVWMRSSVYYRKRWPYNGHTILVQQHQIDTAYVYVNCK